MNKLLTESRQHKTKGEVGMARQRFGEAVHYSELIIKMQKDIESSFVVNLELPL